MKQHLPFALLSLAVLFTSVPQIAHAATITWGAPTNISGDTDVSTGGTLVTAVQFDVSGTVANGVPFTGVPASGSASTLSFAGGSIATSPSTSFVESATGSSLAPFIQLSANYRDVIWTWALGEFGIYPTTLTLTGLATGATYQFEFWENNSGANSNQAITATAGNSVTLNTNTTSAIGGLGQYDIGTFVADGSTEAIQFNAPGGLNAFQLRQTSTVPEPGTAALLTCALGALFCRRRRA
ncbi:protein of unknown function DUF1555 [Chthoniobacter flavus Ellin428]|uniref:PEP-CTERM protein-sorting domain-containing protein n=1 Tax=Chthoniobacter flavus Ellin428 TaxID=497964 RepID=B4DAS8_9BACT|nr:PEP-CTERM sorting domain-containing protein [Chthoniobacter flavus]EDY16488.1 protein of unknown function DUF1555 [Chthoniobacter flavus Ellin428]TCO92755.1 putative secreted protein with PEP-CTERM sorting signal [Chthoniobacter flavus]